MAGAIGAIAVVGAACLGLGGSEPLPAAPDERLGRQEPARVARRAEEPPRAETARVDSTSAEIAPAPSGVDEIAADLAAANEPLDLDGGQGGEYDADGEEAKPRRTVEVQVSGHPNPGRLRVLAASAPVEIERTLSAWRLLVPREVEFLTLGFEDLGEARFLDRDELEQGWAHWRLGASVELRGCVLGDPAELVVRIQEFLNGRWVRLAELELDAGGEFCLETSSSARLRLGACKRGAPFPVWREVRPPALPVVLEVGPMGTLRLPRPTTDWLRVCLRIVDADGCAASGGSLDDLLALTRDSGSGRAFELPPGRYRVSAKELRLAEDESRDRWRTREVLGHADVREGQITRLELRPAREVFLEPRDAAGEQVGGWLTLRRADREREDRLFLPAWVSYRVLVFADERVNFSADLETEDGQRLTAALELGPAAQGEVALRFR